MSEILRKGDSNILFHKLQRLSDSHLHHHLAQVSSGGQ